MEWIIREMTIEDFDEVYDLWQSLEGVGLNQTDTKENIAQYLDNNPGISLVALNEEKIIGAILGGQDGYRGFIHHLGVMKSYQKKGIGRMLVETCLSRLFDQGITRSHLFVYTTNISAFEFWKKLGWFERIELKLMTKDINK